ncbi:MAG: hypothetical protein M3O70_15060 [Actinomycetota bacterium]|nr:hypothetical protein [Actinomycetota bacterium]
MSTTVATTGITLVLGAAPALAHFCTVADKPPAAGVQVLVDGNTDDVVWVSQGVQQRWDRMGEEKFFQTFHGWVGIDFDGDRVADFAVLLPGGQEGHLPMAAYENGPDCHGVVHIGQYFADCT